MRNYRDLQVWGKAHNLTLDLYRVSRGFREKKSMESQINCDGQQHLSEPTLRKARAPHKR